MDGTMRTALWYGPEDVRIEQRPIPEVDDDSVLIKTMVSLTCGTDVKTFFRGHPRIPVGGNFGHEVSGVVVKVGKNVTKFKVGDRIATHNTAPCGSCYWCKTGRNDGSCEHKSVIVGGHSEYVLIPGQIVKINAFHLPDDVSFKAGALLEPLSCAVYGAESTRCSAGDTVVILGAGPIGLMIAMLLKRKGMHIIQADYAAPRLEIAKKLGVDEVLDLNTVDDDVAALRAMTPEGRGADATVDATGQPSAWENCIGIVRKGGFVNLFGGCKGGSKITIDTTRMHYDGLTIAGFYHTTPNCVRMAFDMICRHEIPEDILITGEYPFDRFDAAIRAHASQSGIKSALLYE